MGFEIKQSAQPNGFAAGQEGELVGLATAKSLLNLSATNTAHDPMLLAFLASVNRSVYEWTGNRLLKKPAADWDYVISGIGSRVLNLPQWPVAAAGLTSFEEGYYLDANTWQATRTVPVNEYVLNSDAGTIHGLNRHWGPARHNLRVVYPGGPTTVPDDILEAVTIWLGVKYERMKKRRWDRSSEGFQAESKTFYERDIPKDVRLILDRYRRFEVGNFA